MDADKPINMGTFTEFLKMLGSVEGTDGSYIVRGKFGEAEVRVGQGGNKVLISSTSKELRVHIAGFVARASICGECNLCVNWCPTKALRRVGSGGPSFIVDESKCINCLLCSKACPSAQYLVYRRPEIRGGGLSLLPY